MQREAIGSSRLKAPDDGIVSSHRPRGWLGREWLSLVDRIAGEEYADRVARGRSWARSGRVRDLWFSPGIANAQVVEQEISQVSIRVAVFQEAQWQRALELLAGDLRNIAALLEGTLPERLMVQFRKAGLPLVPTPEELEGHCGCEDFALPCAHVAAVHHVLADALDGEPFLLLTLRGRPREQILAGLRRLWGDPEPLRAVGEAPDEPPPDGDWFQSPAPLASMAFSFDGGSQAMGLLELGPPPGQAELERALKPLYEAGGRSALEIALRELDEQQPRRRRRDRLAVPVPLHEPKKENLAMAPTDEAAAQNEQSAGAPAPGSTLTERLVDLLARVESAKSKEIADALKTDMVEVRQELLELERLGVVYRTGQTRGTRWWLG